MFLVSIRKIKDYYEKKAFDKFGVVGVKTGELYVVGEINGKQLILSDNREISVKAFRTVDTIVALLEKYHIIQYEVELDKWDIGSIYDPHAKSVEIRAKKRDQKADLLHSNV